MRKINEECGVFGMFSKSRKPLARYTYYGLFALQHRGQESAGIVVNDDGVFRFYRELGLVSEAITKETRQSFRSSRRSVFQRFKLIRLIRRM